MVSTPYADTARFFHDCPAFFNIIKQQGKTSVRAVILYNISYCINILSCVRQAYGQIMPHSQLTFVDAGADRIGASPRGGRESTIPSALSSETLTAKQGFLSEDIAQPSAYDSTDRLVFEQSRPSHDLKPRATLETHLTVSPVNNSTIKQETTTIPFPMSPWCQWCCPCVLLGSMHSDEWRESGSVSNLHPRDSSFLSCCFRYEICTEKRIHLGSRGCGVCLYSAILCLCGWPCSPCLQCYVWKLDRELKRIHPDDKNLSVRTSVCCISWPFTIVRHKNIYDQRVVNGTLHYSWAHDVSFESKEPPRKTLFVAGVTPGCGKSTLAKKLCGDPDQEERDHTRMHIGVASLHNPGYDRSAVLEVWDFPSRLEGLVQNYCPDFAILVYDSGDPQSFADIQAFWGILKESWKEKVRVFLVGSKFDLWSKDVDIFEDLNAALWKDSSLKLTAEASEWAQSEEIDFRLVSCPLNEGVQGIMKTISDVALKSNKLVIM